MFAFLTTALDLDSSSAVLPCWEPAGVSPVWPQVRLRAAPEAGLLPWDREEDAGDCRAAGVSCPSWCPSCCIAGLPSALLSEEGPLDLKFMVLHASF